MAPGFAAKFSHRSRQPNDNFLTGKHTSPHANIISEYEGTSITSQGKLVSHRYHRLFGARGIESLRHAKWTQGKCMNDSLCIMLARTIEKSRLFGKAARTWMAETNLPTTNFRFKLSPSERNNSPHHSATPAIRPPLPLKRLLVLLGWRLKPSYGRCDKSHKRT